MPVEVGCVRKNRINAKQLVNYFYRIIVKVRRTLRSVGVFCPERLLQSAQALTRMSAN